MGRLLPFPQHSEVLSTTPGTGEAVTPLPGGFSLACSHRPMDEFEEAKGEEARKEHLASLANSVYEVK